MFRFVCGYFRQAAFIGDELDKTERAGILDRNENERCRPFDRH